MLLNLLRTCPALQTKLLVEITARLRTPDGWYDHTIGMDNVVIERTDMPVLAAKPNRTTARNLEQIPATRDQGRILPIDIRLQLPSPPF